MAKQPTILTPSEVEILKRGVDDPDHVTDYFFRPAGHEEGFKLDDGFTEDGAWQKKVHQADQSDITVIGGFGSGKTVGIGISACVWAMLTTDFKFLNAAPKAWQAKLMFDNILTFARDTRFEEMIEVLKAPYPKITIKYQIEGVTYESSLEFMSVDKNAQGILSWEGDWLNIDEAGQLDDLEEIIRNVGTRLRGTIRGRERLGRFSMTTNSWDNYYLWYYFDLAQGQPEHYLSVVVGTKDNTNVTPEQYENMLMRIPKDERDRFLEGTRPEGRGNFFDKGSIYECENEDHLIVQHQAEQNAPKWKYEKLHGPGVVLYQEPPSKGSVNVFLGDPGVGEAPRRDAPVWMGWEVSYFPKRPARLVYFWWGNGHGRISPFIDKMLHIQELYNPIFMGMDSTGAQKNMATLLNEYILKQKELDETDPLADNVGLETVNMPDIVGLDFSGTKKMSYLHAGRLFVEGKLLTWPKGIVGIRSQLSNYDPEKDKSKSKLPQDIVATVAMTAHSIRGLFNVSPEEMAKRARPNHPREDEDPRSKRGSNRTKRSRKARQAIRQP